MFWNRIGGGVVPSFVPMRDSPRSPTFASGIDKARRSEESNMSGSATQSVDAGAEAAAEGESDTRKSDDDPFQTKDGDEAKRISIGKTIISPEVRETLTAEEEKQVEEMVEAQLRSESAPPTGLNAKPQLQRHRSASNPPPPTPPRKKDERLSLAIPGSFE